MAFLSKMGNLLKQSVGKSLSSELSASKPSIFQAIRCMSSSKLFIGGLSYNTDDTSLREAFGAHGEVIEARVIMDRETGRSRGFGFVTFTSTEEASSAISAMDGQDLHGRMVRVNYATDRPGGAGGGGFRSGGGGYGGGGYGGGGYGGGGGGYGGGGGGYGGGGGNYGGNQGGGYGGGGGSYDNNGGFGGGSGYDGGNSGGWGGSSNVASGSNDNYVNDAAGVEGSFPSGSVGTFDQGEQPMGNSFNDNDGPAADGYANKSS